MKAERLGAIGVDSVQEYSPGMCNTEGYNIAPWGDIRGVTVPRPACASQPSQVKMQALSQVWGRTPLIPASGKQRQEDLSESEACLGYMVSSRPRLCIDACLKQKYRCLGWGYGSGESLPRMFDALDPIQGIKPGVVVPHL